MLKNDRKIGSVDGTIVITIQNNMEESSNIKENKYDIENQFCSSCENVDGTGLQDNEHSKCIHDVESIKY